MVSPTWADTTERVVEMRARYLEWWVLGRERAEGKAFPGDQQCRQANDAGIYDPPITKRVVVGSRVRVINGSTEQAKLRKENLPGRSEDRGPGILNGGGQRGWAR